MPRSKILPIVSVWESSDMIVWENRGLIKTHPKLRDPRRPQLLIVAFALGVVIIALATLARGPRALVIRPAPAILCNCLA